MTDAELLAVQSQELIYYSQCIQKMSKLMGWQSEMLDRAKELIGCVCSPDFTCVRCEFLNDLEKGPQ